MTTQSSATIRLLVEDPPNRIRLIEGTVGSTLMQSAVWSDVRGIVADCGGDGGCATCHVHVDEAWLDRLPPPSSRERGTLRFAHEARANSRLSCFITLESKLDGLTFAVPARQL